MRFRAWTSEHRQLGAPVRIAVAITLFAVGVALPASATTLTASLTGTNGDGIFSSTLPCAEGGDGPTWRYFWLDQAASSPGGALTGLWDGSFEVHDAGDGHAFIPNDEGRLEINVERGGTGLFATRGDGGCGNAALDLSAQPDGDSQVAGTLPIVALGGTGAFRGLSGSGTISFALELGAGADNVADISLAGDLDVLDPRLAISDVSARWDSIGDFRDRRLTVVVTVTNAADAGDAFDVAITGVAGGTGRFVGVPTAAASRIAAGETGVFTFIMLDAGRPHSTHTIDIVAAGNDGLIQTQAPVTTTATFSVPPPRGGN